MEHLALHPPEPSVAGLLGGIVTDAQVLLAREVALLKLEARAELQKARRAALALGLGFGLVAAGGLWLSMMLVQILVVFTELPLWGCYGIVGGGLLVLGGVWLAVGKSTATDLARVPQPTGKTRKENGSWLTEPTTSHRI